MSDGLTALAQQQLARMAAGSGCGALLGYALSHVGHLELFTSSSTPCVYHCSCLRRLTDVHGSGTLWSFTKELIALGPAPWMYSPKPWQLGAGTDRVASDLDVSALSTSRSSQIWAEYRVSMCQCDSMV